MENLIVIPENEKQLSFLKALLKEMKIEFRSQRPSNKDSADDLDRKIKTAREEKERGELVTIDPHNLWESI